MERLPDDAPAALRLGHEFRYHLAAGFLHPGDTVLDAACGTGYGARILTRRGGVNYAGVDREPTGRCGNFIKADLTSWRPTFDYDVFVGFETIEHLPEIENYILMAQQARRTIVMSVPIVPTVHMNPYHLRDYQPGELASLVATRGWRLMQTVAQPSELAEICVFGI